MLKVAIALGLAIVFGAVGDILLSVGMKNVGEVSVRRIADLPPLVRAVLTNAHVMAGVLSMAIYMGAYLAALALVDVSVANPLTALSYVIATGYAATRLRERVAPMRWGGVVLITLGAIFVGLSS
jgi:drug/metabolite transporter (DMT)-like permease